ncbi:MAG: Rieske 2Fe-2S domain-containing protein [Actinobacteria bacterium]|nr:Rieske 2Fe-2S domain-containing protein [Actinomycetota bacterium]
MGRARDTVLSGLVLLLGRGRRRPGPNADRIVPDLPESPGAELAVLALLGLTSLAASGFVVVYAISGSTQLLGLSLGLAFLFLAAALIVVAKKLIATEEIVEEYPPLEHPNEQELIAEVMEESGSRFTRRGLFRLGLLGAGGTLGLAILAPALSFGPFFQIKYFLGTPWRKGRRLVDETGRPYKASDIEPDQFYTAFPEAIPEADKEEQGASLIVVRLPPASLRLPPDLQGYDAGGIVAYSKICTHAGCAISMYRAPLFQPDEPKPALVCPCHYSTFDPATGGTVIFGPAGRPLPMLPLFVDAKGYLRAKGNFNGPVGPTWWGVHEYKAEPS